MTALRLLAFLPLLACLRAEAEPVSIRYACSAGGDNLKLLHRDVEKFEKAHPGIEIRIEPIADNYEQKLLSEYAAGIAPDVANMSPNRFTMFASRDALLNLSTFPDIDGPEVDIKGRYQNIVDAFRRDGNLYAIPRDIACSAYIYYNKKLFRDAGIPYPDGSWTWDMKVRPELREKDFIWVMRELTKRREGDVRPYQYGFTTAWPQLWMSTLLASSNVRMWDSDERPTKLYLDSPQVVEVFRFASDCINRFHWMPSNNEVLLGGGSTMQDEFRKGRIAMLQSGAWEVRDMRKKMKGEWDIAPFPAFARGENPYLPGEGTGLGIFKTSRHPKEAWEFVKWYTGREGLLGMSKAGESQPSIRAMALEPGVWLPGPDARGVDRLPENLAITDKVSMRIRYLPLPEYFRALADTSIQGMFYGVLSGENDPAESLAKAQRNLPGQLALLLKRENAPPYPFGLGLAVGIGLVLALAFWIYKPEFGRKLSPSEKIENRSAYWFLIPWFCGLGLTVGPMIYSLLLSFAQSDIIQTPKWRGLGNYADLLNPRIDDNLGVSLRQTFYFAALSIPIGTAFALALALLLNQKIRGVPLFRALYYLPSLASAVAMSLIWMRLYDKDHGLINQILYGADGKSGLFHIGPVLSQWIGTPGESINWLGNTKTVLPAFVIMGLWGAGAGTIIFLAGLQGISQSYFEAATLDGAGIWKRFRNVTVPMMTPYLFFSLIMGVIGTLQVFSQSFVMTDGGPDRATSFVMVWLWKKAFSELEMGYASAIAWILFAIILVLTMIQLWLASKWVYYEGDLTQMKEAK